MFRIDRPHCVPGTWACEFSNITTREDCLCQGNVPLGLCTGHPRRGFVTDLLFGACVCIPFVSVALCCLMQNGKFRFNSLRKILAMES